MPEQVIAVDISNVSKAYAVLGGFIVIYGLISYVAKDRLYMSEPLIAVTVGIITGPYVLGWVDPLSWGTTEETNYVTYELSRLVVGVQVLFTGISLPKAYLRKEAISLLILLAGVMTVAWFISALLIWGLIPHLTYLESLAIAAAITPTDPVLANSITKGRFAEKHVPHNLRNIIVAESGANDGLGFPFLFLALYLLARTGEDRGTSVGEEVGRWVYGVVLYRILLSCVVGTIIGILAHKTLKWAETRGYIDRDNFFAYGFGLALFTLGTTGLYGSDDILACFVAGNAFTWKDWYRVRTQVEEEDTFQDIIDSLLNAAIFIYIGAIIPWDAYNTADQLVDINPWQIVVLGITILLLRRLPWVVALSRVIPAITNLSEALFAGWFGPIGVGAVFYIQVALREIPDDGTRDRLRAVYAPVVLFCVFSSVLTHGITIPIAKLYPNIVRRTTSFSQRRTISFTSRPVSRATSISPQQTENNDKSAATDATTSEKMIWNPFFALVDGVKSIALFWRKDSFWRKENAHQRQQRLIKESKISRPIKATKMASMEQDQTEGEGSSDSNQEEGSVSAEIQVVDTAESAANKLSSSETVEEVQKPELAADPKDKQGASDRKRETWLQSVEHALERELQREREQAIREGNENGPLRTRPSALEGIPMTQTRTMSQPGTPGASRVRFQS